MPSKYEVPFGPLRGTVSNRAEQSRNVTIRQMNKGEKSATKLP